MDTCWKLESNKRLQKKAGWDKTKQTKEYGGQKGENPLRMAPVHGLNYHLLSLKYKQIKAHCINSVLLLTCITYSSSE